MANVVKKVFSYDRALRQVENSTGVLQAQTAATLQNIQSQVSHFRQAFETELMPELKATIDVARNHMEAMANESHKAVQRFSLTLDKVVLDNTGVTIKFGVEALLIILFLLVAKMCRSEIKRIEDMLKPNAFFRLEKDLLQMLRLACIFSCMAIVSKVFYIVILQRTDATPTDIVHLALLPIAAVIIYKILCLLVFVSRHVLRFLGFVMWTPFMILIGSPLFFFYLVLFAPTVWLYRVYQARWRLRNQNAIYIMHSLVIILSIFFVKMFDVLYILRGYSEKQHYDVVYASVATYVLYYAIALYIKVRNPIPQEHSGHLCVSKEGGSC